MILETTCLTLDDLPRAPVVLKGISSRFIREHKVVPIELKNNVLKVLMADPSDEGTIDALRVAAGAEIIACAGDLRLIEDYIARFYGTEQQNINRIIEDIDTLEFRDEEDIGHLKDLASEAPIIKLVNLFISRAVESRASDIHHRAVRGRIEGPLPDRRRPPRYRIAPQETPGGHRFPGQDHGEAEYCREAASPGRPHPAQGRREREIDLRVSTIPVLYGESVVMRILDKESIVIDLERLGFSPETLDRFQQLITKPHGIVLVTGPTGSGKTTTLYGALDKINSPDKKIITVEDPVEYQLKGINQIQVKPQIGLTFANSPAPYRPAGPGHHHDRRNPRSGNRGDRHPVGADRPPRLLDPAHE